MKKKIIIIAFVFAIMLSGCASKESDTNEPTDIKNKEVYQGDTASSITMYIKEGTLKKSSATVVIEDNSENKNTYSKNFQLFTKADDNWEELELINDNKTISSENYYPNETGKLELAFSWQSLYGKLASGAYKLVATAKNIEKNETYYFSTDFIII